MYKPPNRLVGDDRRVAVPVATNQLFDYWLPAGLKVEPGNVVRVVFGRRRIHGVVTEIVRSSELSPDRILPVQEVVESLPPLPADLRALAQFVAAYYQQPIGQCFAQLVPPLGAKPGGRERRRTDASPQRKRRAARTVSGSITPSARRSTRPCLGPRLCSPCCRV